MNGVSWCIPPIKWLQKWVVPPDSADWQRVAFQPMLYLSIWLGVIVVLIKGDFTNVPSEFADDPHGAFWAWGGLGLLCPPMALGALRMIREDSNGYWKYRGLWLRLGADIGMFAALLTYTTVRIQIGDFHVIPVACLMASTLFVFHLVLRDFKRLHEVEKLASALRQKAVDDLGE